MSTDASPLAAPFIKPEIKPEIRQPICNCTRGFCNYICSRCFDRYHHPPLTVDPLNGCYRCTAQYTCDECYKPVVADQYGVNQKIKLQPDYLICLEYTNNLRRKTVSQQYCRFSAYDTHEDGLQSVLRLLHNNQDLLNDRLRAVTMGWFNQSINRLDFALILDLDSPDRVIYLTIKKIYIIDSIDNYLEVLKLEHATLSVKKVITL